MAKRLEIVGNSMAEIANATILIVFDHIPDTMTSKMRDGIRDILEGVIKNAGYRGRWRFTSIRSEKQRHPLPAFQAKTIIDNQRRFGGPGIKVLVKPPDSGKVHFSGIIVPPSGVNAVEAFGLFVKPKPDIQQAEQDGLYLGRISGLKYQEVLVDIFPSNPNGYKAVSCYVTELTHQFCDKPSDEFRMRQLIMLKCTGFDKNHQPIFNRKILIPNPDPFDPKPKGGELSMNGFTESLERVAIALTYIKYSIDRHANKVAWDRAAERGVIGGVFLEGKELAFAPACFVQYDLKKGLQNEWGAKKVTTIGGLMRYLVTKEYIWPSTDSAGETVGYCMLKDGYELTRTKPTVLPEYYDPPTSKKGESIEVEIPEQTDLDPIEPAVIDMNFVELLDQFDAYQAKKARRDQITALLADHDVLIKEGNEIDTWLESHKDIVNQVMAVKKLSERIAAIKL